MGSKKGLTLHRLVPLVSCYFLKGTFLLVENQDGVELGLYASKEQREWVRGVKSKTILLR